MTADELAPAVLAQLEELDVFEYELTRYTLCAASTADGAHHDRLLVMDKAVFTKWFGRLEDSSLPFVAAATLASVAPSPYALPGGVVEAVRRCQEVRMGTTLIRLRLDDGSEVLYEAATPSFPDLPRGRHVVDAECAEIADEARFDRVYGLDSAWCLVTNAELLRATGSQDSRS
jgi:hypothetical protein